MPTSHRADKSRSVSLRGIAITLVLLVAAAAVGYLVIGTLTGSPDDVTGSGSTASAAPSDTPTTSAAPSASAAPGTGAATTGPGKKPSSKKPDARIARVLATPPHRISIGGVVTDAPFGAALSATDGRLIPDEVDALQRVGDRGVPGSPGTDTVVVVGASSTSGNGVLDGIDSVRKGAKILLETQNARLTYTVSSVQDVSADRVLSSPAVTEHHTDRLVIDCAHYDDSQRVGDDRVLVATLVKAEPLRP